MVAHSDDSYRNDRYRTQALQVGDYMWVWRDTRNGPEYVMPIVVERKRADDLAGSMLDGRQVTQGSQMLFSKQKCWVKKLVYIVEVRFWVSLLNQCAPS